MNASRRRIGYFSFTISVYIAFKIERKKKTPDNLHFFTLIVLLYFEFRHFSFLGIASSLPVVLENTTRTRRFLVHDFQKSYSFVSHIVKNFENFSNGLLRLSRSLGWRQKL